MNSIIIKDVKDMLAHYSRHNFWLTRLIKKIEAIARLSPEEYKALQQKSN